VVEAVRNCQRGQLQELTLRLPIADGKSLNFLENRANIHQRDYDTSHATLRLTIGQRQLDQLRATGAKYEIVEE